ncbi:cytochrome P450 [Coniella lustricola]|uniref:Cytochrome P450 n=1 Tax=Coniella lustricola TaxID=2025994 RepID=A0A2T3AHF7_9PEZI|nr:cytochrome P450 [Coniella lustricola]
MAPSELVSEWTGIASLATWQTAVKAVVFFLVARCVQFLVEGVRIRAKFRRMQADGIPIPSNHSLLFGHLLVMRNIMKAYPADGHSNYLVKELVLNWRDHFPAGTASCPKVLYLDIWPMESQPIAVFNDPMLSQALAADRFPPRHERVKFLGRAVAGPNQLFEWDGAHHRLWRTRLNPGFSMRNLLALVARGRLVDETEIFRDRLRKLCGAPGHWGAVFEMLPLTIDLTFDIICGAALDYSPGEQTSGPTVLQQGLRTIATEYFSIASLANLHQRLNPLWNWRFYQIHKSMSRELLPHIERHLPSAAASNGNAGSADEKKNPLRPKTIIDLTVKEIEEQQGAGKGAKIPDGFVDDIIGLMKLFIFAGHDTTAINLSFAFHFIQRNPAVLAKLKEEHDAVFGPDTAAVGETLRQSPQLINAMPYTTAVVKETLRMCPVAPSVRDSPASFVLRDPETNQLVPTQGFVLVTGVMSLHTHPDIWPRPTEFLPERWLAQEGDELYSKAATKYAWRPFEWGAMSCIGQELAMIEMKMALLFVLREVEFRTALDVLDEQKGKDIKDRPTVWGDAIYQTDVGLGPPVAGLPTQVRLLKT